MHSSSRWARAAGATADARARGDALDRTLRITLNFHPDRVLDGRSVVEHLADEGVHRSQFETGTSNGGLTAHPGGDRWLWERALFDGACDDAPVAERPKYGALDHRQRPLGGAPRFGSAFLRLREHVLDRSTFCFPDSSMAPTHLGTARHCDLVVLADSTASNDRLDGYVEAHVHGLVTIRDDVEALVLDPCFRGTAVEAAAARLGVPVAWHEGRVLALDELDRHVDYRGAAPVALGHGIARGGVLDAAVIGDAANSGQHHPQAVKQLWHLVACFGRPATPAAMPLPRGEPAPPGAVGPSMGP